MEHPTTDDLTAAITNVSGWFQDASDAIAWHKGRKIEIDPAQDPDGFLDAVPGHVSNMHIAALEDLEARLPDMALRFEHLEAVFDNHLAGVSVDDPQSRDYAQVNRDALVGLRSELVTFTENNAQGSERAVREGQSTHDPEFARITPVAARVKGAIRDTAGLATLRLRRMIGHLDEKYGTSGGD